MLLLWAYVQFEVGPPDEPRWNKPILFDEGVRNGLVAESRDGRHRANAISDWLWLVPGALVVSESIVVPLADDWNLDIAWQQTAMNVQAIGLVGLLSRVGHRAVARQRPDVAECEVDPEYHEGCFKGATGSFPSGHTSGAAVAAGLSCAHHTNLPFYGGGVADLMPCLTLSAMAIGSGVTRMIADRHYISDVFVGGVLGFGTGYLLPVLLHYQGGAGPPERTETPALRWTITPAGGEEWAGLGLYGWF